MENTQTGVINLPPEVSGYIQGYKDLAARQADMIGERTAEVFGLRTKLNATLAELDAVKAERDGAKADLDKLNVEKAA